MRKIATITILLMLPAFFLSAQENVFTKYSYNEGFHNGQLVDLTEDENGVLWFVGLTGVLYSYDGYSFNQYPLPPGIYTNNIYRVVFLRKTKVICLFTNTGIIKFNGEDFEHIPLTSDVYLTYSSTQILTDEMDKVWVRDGNGKVFVFSNDSIRQFSDSAIVSQIVWMCRTPENKIALVSSDNRYVEIDPVSELVTSAGDLPIKEKGSINAIEFFGDKVLYLCSSGVYFGTRTHAVKWYAQTFQNIKSIKTDRFGNHWILARLRLYRVTTRQIELMSSAHGLSDNHIAQIALDRNRTLWICSDHEGVFHYKRKLLQRFALPEGITVSGVLPVGKDSTWIITFGSGMFLRHKSKFSQPSGAEKLDSLLLLGVVRHDKGVLVGTDGLGVQHFRDGKLTRILAPDTMSQFVRCIQSFNGTPYVGTQGGLYRIDGQKMLPVNKDLHSINVLFADQAGQLLIGTQHSGMFRMHGGKLIRWDSTFYNTTAVNFFTQDEDKNIWVSSNRNTVSVYDSAYHLVSRIQLPPFIGSVTSLHFISEGKAIVTADDSIYELTLDHFNIRSINKYDRSDGFEPGELVLGASVKAENNAIYYATSSGCYVFDGLPVESGIEQLPMAYIQKVELNFYDSAAYEYDGEKAGLYRLPIGLKLPPNHNEIMFEFVGNNLDNPLSTRYRFQLSGLSEDWSPLTYDRKAAFTNLDPGIYTFRVQAVNGAGLFSPAAEYTFEILPAFWQTKSFVFISGFAVLVLVFFINKIVALRNLRRYQRDEQVKMSEALKIRQQMSMDFHDELGNKLAAILSYASALRVQNKDRQVSELLEYVENSAQAIYQGTRDFIWSINLESNNVQEVLLYLRDFGVKFFERHGVAFDFQADLSDPALNVVLPEGYNRQIVLIFKEAMTNSYKHGRSSLVTLGVVASSPVYRIYFEDNGIGINGKAAGNGLKNMKKRAEKIGALTRVHGRQEGGTTVSLTFEI